MQHLARSLLLLHLMLMTGFDRLFYCFSSIDSVFVKCLVFCLRGFQVVLVLPLPFELQQHHHDQAFRGLLKVHDNTVQARESKVPAMHTPSRRLKLRDAYTLQSCELSI